jgi:hypothetical protein
MAFELRPGQMVELPSPRMCALAAHHGVPTRLLDMSWTPEIAAFFAADDINCKGLDMAVWAINIDAISNTNVAPLYLRRHQFSFLHAQDGLFLFSYKAPLDSMRLGRWPALEETILGSVRGSPSGPIVRKVTLVSSERDRLLQKLWAERISRAHLMPTLDNVSSALRTCWRWGSDFVLPSHG